FFPAEDGIRDATVTGVQTCALPIFTALNAFSHFLAQYHPHLGVAGLDRALMVEYIGSLRDRQVSESWICTPLVTLRTLLETSARSEERRAGKGRRRMWLEGT